MRTQSQSHYLHFLGATGSLLLFTAPSYGAEQVSVLPIDYNQIRTWTVSDSVSDDPNTDYFVQDLSTNQKWEFQSGDTTLYELLTKLHAVSDNNIKQFAYVGSPPDNGDFVAHGAWIAPLTKDKTPSLVKFRIPHAQHFHASAIRVTWSDRSHDYVLSDGTNVLAENGDSQDPSPLEILQKMIQNYDLNAVWEIPSDTSWASTPVGNQGPVLVFLKTEVTTPATVDTCADRGWWLPKCWRVRF